MTQQTTEIPDLSGIGAALAGDTGGGLAGISAALAGHTIDQIGFLVPDLAKAAASWGAAFPGQQWESWRHGEGTVENLRYRGAPGSFAIKFALIGNGPQLELIEPLEGPSIYHDWIAEHGYGFHHIGVRFDSIAEPVATLEAAGFENIQSLTGSGADGSGGCAYFDLEERLGLILELIERPRVRRPSESLV